jgi:tetratricopeptide (TPR) repeat protein
LINALKYGFLFFFIIAFETKPQSSQFDSLVHTGIKQIYNIKFSEAEKTFRELITDYPDHPAGRFFLAMIDWWRILLEIDSEQYDEIFFQKLEDVIFQCDELLKKNPENVDALFFKGGAIGFRGRLRAYRESWLKAADDGREALPIVERAANLNPNNFDVQLGFGIYNYYADVIPNEYPILKPLMLFFPKGDKQKGIEQLTNTASRGKYAKYEAQYFLMTLYYSYENNPFKAFEYAQVLTEEFPDNPTFQRWKGRIAAKKGDYVLASSVFQEVLDKGKAGFAGYNYSKTIREAAYYVGFQNYNQHQLDSAYYYFKMCEDVSRKVDKEEESGFLINAVLYIGMINDQLGKREDAIDNYREVLKMKEYGNSHRLAKNYLENPLTSPPSIKSKD